GAVARVGDVNQHAGPAARLEPDVGHPAHRVDGGAPGGQVVLEGWLAEDVAEAASRIDPADLPNPWMGLAVDWRRDAIHSQAGAGIGALVGPADPSDQRIGRRPPHRRGWEQGTACLDRGLQESGTSEIPR